MSRTRAPVYHFLTVINGPVYMVHVLLAGSMSEAPQLASASRRLGLNRRYLAARAAAQKHPPILRRAGAGAGGAGGDIRMLNTQRAGSRTKFTSNPPQQRILFLSSDSTAHSAWRSVGIRLSPRTCTRCHVKDSGLPRYIAAPLCSCCTAPSSYRCRSSAHR